MITRMILNETAYFGKGAVMVIAEEVQKRGFKKAFLVTDKGLVNAGLITKVTSILDESGLAYEIYDGVVPNPTVQAIQAGVTSLKEANADYILAVGGGSSIDTAKAIGTIYTNPEYADVLNLEGMPVTKNPSLPILAVPTTAGTASEVTISYVLTDEGKKRKFAVLDAHSIPVCAFIDSEMMMGMPKMLCAATGMDALTHAIEGLVTKAAWELTDALHLKAIEIISRSIVASVSGNAQAREEMALGQYMAGMGFANAGLGLVHGMAHPLTGWYNVPHGIACGALLPIVMDFNKACTGEKYREIAKALKIPQADTLSLESVREKVIETVKMLCKEVNIPQTISELGVKEADLPALAEDALKDICTVGNPREASAEEIVALYRAML